jgi:peptide-methionine (S)-S-oxide reductase
MARVGWFVLSAVLLGLGVRQALLKAQDRPLVARHGRVTAPTSAPATQPGKKSAGDKGKVMTQKAMFGAGCFWGVEEAFRQVPGVIETTVGYSGGTTKNPTYKDVCTDRTGHVEVVLVEYDPAQVGYDKLLEVFWKAHNPTQVNRQGPDVGSQYRSVIFVYSPEQEAAAKASKEKLAASGKFKQPIATAIEPAREFYKAEEYHQKYLFKRGLGSCHVPDGE